MIAVAIHVTTGVAAFGAGFQAAVWLAKRQRPTANGEDETKPAAAAPETGYTRAEPRTDLDGASVLLDFELVRHRLRISSHDLRSFLGPVIGYSDLIRLSDDNDKTHDYVDKIIEAADQIESFANNLPDNVLRPDN